VKSFLQFVNENYVNFSDYNLQQKFNHYNSLLFDGKIPPCPITFARLQDHSGVTYFKQWHGKVVPGTVRIEISTHYKNTERQLDSTLIHEMVHAYLCAVQGDPEAHHGVAFRRMAQKVGRKIGFTIALADRLEDFEVNTPNNVIPFRRKF